MKLSIGCLSFIVTRDDAPSTGENDYRTTQHEGEGNCFTLSKESKEGDQSDP